MVLVLRRVAASSVFTRLALLHSPIISCRSYGERLFSPEYLLREDVQFNTWLCVLHRQVSNSVMAAVTTRTPEPNKSTQFIAYVTIGGIGVTMVQRK